MKRGPMTITLDARACELCRRLIGHDPTCITQVHPCVQGLHRWAWLTAGGQECVMCGVRR